MVKRGGEVWKVLIHFEALFLPKFSSVEHVLNFLKKFILRHFSYRNFHPLKSVLIFAFFPYFRCADEIRPLLVNFDPNVLLVLLNDFADNHRVLVNDGHLCAQRTRAKKVVWISEIGHKMWKSGQHSELCLLSVLRGNHRIG